MVSGRYITSMYFETTLVDPRSTEHAATRNEPSKLGIPLLRDDIYIYIEFRA